MMLITILSEVFMNNWNNVNIKENDFFRAFLVIARYVYRTPQNMFDSQCNLEQVPDLSAFNVDLV